MESIARRLGRQWSTFRTDLTWLRRDMRGERRPFVVERHGPSRYVRRQAVASLAPRELRVSRVTRETPDAVTVHVTEADGSALAFVPGQFLTFHLEVDGAPLRRAYSLSSSPLDGPDATITVKRIPGGRASSWIHEHLAAGDTLRALGPSGTFVAPGENTREFVMIAGGSGITPIASILSTLLRSREQVRVHLLYGNRGEQDIIFRDALDTLDRSHPNLTLTHVLEHPPEGWTGATGRVDAEVLGPWLDALGGLERGAYFLCGPGPMMDGARAVLSSRGVAPAAIFEERFQSPEDAPMVELPSQPVTVRVSADGTDHLVPVEPGSTLLEAALAAGAKMPFSCAMGGCAACKCRLIDGEVAMEEPNCLTTAEREDGWILACASRPLGPARVKVE